MKKFLLVITLVGVVISQIFFSSQAEAYTDDDYCAVFYYNGEPYSCYVEPYSFKCAEGFMQVQFIVDGLGTYMLYFAMDEHWVWYFSFDASNWSELSDAQDCIKLNVWGRCLRWYREAGYRY